MLLRSSDWDQILRNIFSVGFSSKQSLPGEFLGFALVVSSRKSQLKTGTGSGVGTFWEFLAVPHIQELLAAAWSCFQKLRKAGMEQETTEIFSSSWDTNLARGNC